MTVNNRQASPGIITFTYPQLKVHIYLIVSRSITTLLFAINTSCAEAEAEAKPLSARLNRQRQVNQLLTTQNWVSFMETSCQKANTKLR